MSNFSVETKSDGFKEALVAVNRVSKTVQGGRRMSFSAYVVVGKEGKSIGFGHGKALEVPVAIQKAMEDARKNMFKVHLNNGTLYHPIQAKFGATRVKMMPATEGTGMIAGSAMVLPTIFAASILPVLLHCSLKAFSLVVAVAITTDLPSKLVCLISCAVIWLLLRVITKRTNSGFLVCKLRRCILERLARLMRANFFLPPAVLLYIFTAMIYPTTSSSFLSA